MRLKYGRWFKVENIVCNGCSLLCDDVSAEVASKTVNSLGLCRLGHTHLETAVKHKVSSKDKDLEKAAEILANAEKPLLFGWAHVTDEAIKEGIELASTLDGHFASIADFGPRSAMSHNIHAKGLEIDLEYVRNNGEFIIYWGSDPSESLHRHPSRFAVLPRGEKIPEGIESRTIGVVDVRQTETMKMANHRLVIPVGTDAELLDTIISEIEGKSAIKDKVLGIPGGELIGFVNGFQKSDCTVIFYGSGLINSGNHDANLTRIAKLVEVLRKKEKEAYALPMFVQSNTMGIIKNKQGVGSLQEIANGEYDISLIVGDDALANLPGPLAKALAKTKIVYVGTPGGLTDKRAEVSIHTTDAIIAGVGTMTRVDMNEVQFKKWKASKDDDTTRDILSKLRELIRMKKS
jgi:formylmethanofuran dehydrogenase subunit B